jgi:AraC-like DNA-binding protein
MCAFTCPTTTQDGRLRRLLQMMEDDPRSTIDDWARAFHLSYSYLSHLFKQATGASLGHMLHEHRMQRAAYLLATSDMSVKEIANAVGYEHTSSFTRAFERRFGRGPRSYRRTNDGD